MFYSLVLNDSFHLYHGFNHHPVITTSSYQGCSSFPLPVYPVLATSCVPVPNLIQIQTMGNVIGYQPQVCLLETSSKSSRGLR